MAGVVVFLAAAAAVTFNSRDNEPHQPAWWVHVSPSAPPAVLQVAESPDLEADRPLVAAVESSPAPDPTPTQAPVTPTPKPPEPTARPATPAPATQPPAAPAAAPGAPAAPPTPAPTPMPTPPPTPPPGAHVAGLAKQLLDLINAERSAAGVPQLAVSASLMNAAEGYAEFHFLNADPFQLNHLLDGPLLDRLQKHGYTGGGGEALVTGPVDAQVLMNTWMNSAPHRAILLSAQYVHIGVGCYQGPYTNSDGFTFDAIALCVADLGFPV